MKITINYIVKCTLVLLFAFSASVIAQETEANAGSVIVEGIVLSQDGQPLKNIKVSVQEKKIDTNTDDKGGFFLLVEPNDVLVIDEEGYHPFLLQLTGLSSYTIRLQAYRHNEQEKISVAYGTQSKREMVSAVSTMGSRDVDFNSVGNAEDALNGTLAGLYSIKSGGTNYDESNYTFLVRGKATNATTSPLVLIDNMEGSLDLVDPKDIESITVLKDASSLALYGMKGANGAILVTTKKGSATNSHIDVNIEAGFQTPEYVANRLNSYQYATLYNEALSNDGQAALYNAEMYKNASDPYAYPDTDYIDEFLGNSSTYQKYNFSATGGNKIARYYVGASYMMQDGLFEQTNANMENNRFTFRTNVDVNLTKDLTFTIQMSGVSSELTSPFISTSTTSNASIHSVFNTLMTLPSIAFPMFNKDGSLGGTSEYQTNPYGLLNNTGTRTDATRLFNSRVSAEYDLSSWINGLSADMFYAFENYNKQYTSVSHSYAVFEEQSDGTYTQFGTDDSKDTRNAGLFTDYYRYSLFGAGLKYSKAINETSNILLNLMYNQSIESVAGSTPDMKYQALMLRAQYALLNRYYAEITSSYQGSSYYEAGKRTGLFPALGLGWIISDESWMKSATGLDFLKLRGSVGLVGNDQTNGTMFPYRQVYTATGGYSFGVPNGYSDGATEGTLANADETWESSLKVDVGIDVEFLKHFSLTADYFSDKRTDILVSYGNVIPTLIGIDVPMYNAGEVINRGFDATFTYCQEIGKGSVFVSANMLYAKNEVIELGEIAYEYDYQYQKGYSLDAIFGFESNGLYLDESAVASAPTSTYGVPQLGDIAYVNQNPDDDDVIDERDMVYIGNSLPELIFGATFGGTYKGFDIQATIEGSSIYDTHYRPDTFSEYSYDNRWSSDNPSADALYPRVSIESSYNEQTSQFWLEEGAMLRVSAAELGYTLPSELTKRLHLTTVRVYANANNPISFIRLKDNSNPEASEAGYSEYPLMRTFTMGLSLRF